MANRMTHTARAELASAVSTRQRKSRQAVPEPRRRVPLGTFADWNDPLPGSMEIDLGGPLRRCQPWQLHP
jgi:hypothetical protein